MIKELFIKDNLNLDGKGVFRRAVRGIIIYDSKILLINSHKNGDYKFPGGGIENNETHEQALRREIAEECGLELQSVDTFLGHIIEYDEPQEEFCDYFKMDSYYYSCSVKNFNTGSLQLDSYEEDLMCIPKWVDINEAIKINKKIMANPKGYPRWTIRDTMFLEYINNLPVII